MDNKQNRFKSWALWVSIFALIGFIVKETTGYDLGPFLNGFADVLLPVLAGFGIVNNPTDKSHF